MAESSSASESSRVETTEYAVPPPGCAGWILRDLTTASKSYL